MGGGIVAGPHASHRIGGAAHKPGVPVVIGGAGLAVDLPAGNGSPPAGAVLAVDRLFQELVHNSGVLAGKDLLRYVVGVVQDAVAVVVVDIIIGIGFVVLAAVAENLIGGGDFPDGHAAVEAADGHGRQLRAVSLGVQVLEVEFFRQEVIDIGGAYQIGQLYSRRVLGLADGLGYRHGAFRFPAGVVGAGLAGAKVVFKIFVLEEGGIVDHAHVHGGAVYADGLNGGTGLALGVGGIAEPQVAGFLFPGAHSGQYPAAVVHHHKAGLDVFIGAVVVLVGVFLFGNFLDLRIHSAVDFQAAVIEHILGPVFIDVIGLLQVGDDVVIQGLDIPVPHRGAVFLLAFGFLAVAHKLHVFGFFHGLVVFVLSDFPLVIHFPQHYLLALLVVFGVNQGVIPGGVLGNAGNGGTFGNIALADVLAEIELGCCLHAVAAAAKADDIQIRLQDLILGVFILQLQGHKDFPHLAQQAHLVFAGDVLDQLLGDSGTAAAVLAGEQLEHRAEGGGPVHTVVLSEALVLNGHNGVLHGLGDVGKIHPHPVFRAVQGEVFLKLPVLVLHIDNAAVIQLLQIQAGRFCLVPLVDDKGDYSAPYYHTGNSQHHKQGQKKLPKRTPDGLCSGGCAPGTFFFCRDGTGVGVVLVYVRFFHVPPTPCISSVFCIFFQSVLILTAR